jgi:hypothetical protein
VLLVIYNLLGINTKCKPVVAFGRWLPTWREALQMIITFALAVIGWIIFRCEDMTEAYHFLSRMFTTMFDSMPVVFGKKAMILGCVVIVVEWLQRGKQHGLQLSSTHGVFRYSVARYLLYATLLVVMFFFAGEVQTFIYFQF